jgi:hypothetical protein
MVLAIISRMMVEMKEDAILQVKYTGQYAGPRSRWCGGSRGVVGTAGLLSRRYGGFAESWARRRGCY